MTTTFLSPVGVWLEELRVEEARLACVLGQVRRVLASLDGEGRATVDALVCALAARVPDMCWPASWMETQLRDAGWTTTSCDPENIVRSALARGVQGGWLTRPERGLYRYAGAGEET